METKHYESLTKCQSSVEKLRRTKKVCLQISKVKITLPHNFLFRIGLSIKSLFYKTRLLMVLLYIFECDEMFADKNWSVYYYLDTKRKATGYCMTIVVFHLHQNSDNSHM